jgi:hypothetical protein
MPMDRSKYPDNWKWLSKQAIADAGNKCELCYAPNGAEVFRFTNKQNRYPWKNIDSMGCDLIDLHLNKGYKIKKNNINCSPYQL